MAMHRAQIFIVIGGMLFSVAHAMQQEQVIPKYNGARGLYNTFTIPVVVTDLSKVDEQSLTQGQKLALQHVREYREQGEQHHGLPEEIYQNIKSYIGEPLFSTVTSPIKLLKELKALLKIEQQAHNYPLLELFKEDFKRTRKAWLQRVADNLCVYSHSLVDEENCNHLKHISFLKPHLALRCIYSKKNIKPYAFIAQELQIDSLRGKKQKKHLFKLATFLSLYVEVISKSPWPNGLQDSYTKTVYARNLLELYPDALKEIDKDNPILAQIDSKITELKNYFKTKKDDKKRTYQQISSRSLSESSDESESSDW